MISLFTSVLIAIGGGILLIASSRCGGLAEGQVRALLAKEREIEPHQKDSNTTYPGLYNYPQDHLRRWVYWLIGASLGGLIAILLPKVSPLSVLVTAVIGCLVGELIFSRRREASKRFVLRQMEFYLPTVMERIVMAVGAGLDIIPALREAAGRSRDPVSDLMRWIVNLSESGTSVEGALELASKQNITPALKHACIHLGLAYRQGGEIVRPLKELSDATQVAYQETVEEQIAKLPVKAVLPLVLTFTGLIVCFLTVPLMQVGSLTKEVASVAGR